MTETTRNKLWASPFVLGSALFLIGFFTFFSTLSGAFVWDDHYLIAYNPRMRAWEHVTGFFTSDMWHNAYEAYDSGFYRPLTLLAHFLNYQIWGDYRL